MNIDELRCATIDGDVRAAWLYLEALVQQHGDVELCLSPIGDHILLHGRRVCGGRENTGKSLGELVLRLFPAASITPTPNDDLIPF